MGTLRRTSRENAEHNGLEQTLGMLYRATYRAARLLHLPPEDSKDAAMQEVDDYFAEWVQAAKRAAEREPGSVALLTEEEIRGRASAAASDAARKYRRDRDHRANPASSDTEDAQTYGDRADPRASPQDEVQQREFMEAIAASLAKLPGATGTQVWQHHVGQVSWVDLGRLHGCSAGAIRKRLLRALPHIREELARQEWDETGST